MARMVIDAQISATFRKLQEQVELYDESGNLVGYFTPRVEKTIYDSVEIPVSDDELRRRQAKGGGRPLTEIFADLERRS
jgi:hypothetical protein